MYLICFSFLKNPFHFSKEVIGAYSLFTFFCFPTENHVLYKHWSQISVFYTFIISIFDSLYIWADLLLN